MCIRKKSMLMYNNIIYTYVSYGMYITKYAYVYSISDISVSAALTVFGGGLQVGVGLGVSGVVAQVKQAQGAVEACYNIARTLTCIHIFKYTIRLVCMKACKVKHV